MLSKTPRLRHLRRQGKSTPLLTIGKVCRAICRHLAQRLSNASQICVNNGFPTRHPPRHLPDAFPTSFPKPSRQAAPSRQASRHANLVITTLVEHSGLSVDSYWIPLRFGATSPQVKRWVGKFVGEWWGTQGLPIFQPRGSRGSDDKRGARVVGGMAWQEVAISASARRIARIVARRARATRYATSFRFRFVSVEGSASPPT